MRVSLTIHQTWYLSIAARFHAVQYRVHCKVLSRECDGRMTKQPKPAPMSQACRKHR